MYSMQALQITMLICPKSMQLLSVNGENEQEDVAYEVTHLINQATQRVEPGDLLRQPSNKAIVKLKVLPIYMKWFTMYAKLEREGIYFFFE